MRYMKDLRFKLNRSYFEKIVLSFVFLCFRILEYWDGIMFLEKYFIDLDVYI